MSIVNIEDTSSMAMPAFVTGLVGFFTCFFPPVGLIFSSIGLYLGYRSRNSTRRTLARIGMAFAAIGALVALFFVFAFVWGWWTFPDSISIDR